MTTTYKLREAMPRRSIDARRAFIVARAAARKARAAEADLARARRVEAAIVAGMKGGAS